MRNTTLSTTVYVQGRPHELIYAREIHRGQHDIHYLLDHAHDRLLHVNHGHCTVFLTQCIDWPRIDMSREQRVQYMLDPTGFVHARNSVWFHCVYRNQAQVFYLDRAHQVLTHCMHTAASGTVMVQSWNTDYTVHDTAQTVYDRARWFAYTILQQDYNAQPVRPFPLFQ
jgi:hypothetical protein